MELTGYDEIVLATGVAPRLPAIPGIDHPKGPKEWKAEWGVAEPPEPLHTPGRPRGPDHSATGPAGPGGLPAPAHQGPPGQAAW
jgi:hypothetical protein